MRDIPEKNRKYATPANTAKIVTIIQRDVVPLFFPLDFTIVITLYIRGAKLQF